MGLFSNQLLDVIEWNETRNDVIFWKWKNSEIKKNSRLIIRPGQDAIFMHNGKVEGVFTEEGNYEIEPLAEGLWPGLPGADPLPVAYHDPALHRYQ